MKKILLLLTVFTLLISCAGCKTETETPELPADEPPHFHDPASVSEQIPENEPHYTCGNTPTVIQNENGKYTFEYNDSLKLSSLVICLDYSEEKLCDCETEFKVTPEFADTYEVSLSNYFVRVNGKQANLTEDEAQTIKQIYENVTANTDGLTYYEKTVYFPELPDPYSTGSGAESEILFSDSLQTMYDSADAVIIGRVTAEEETVYEGTSSPESFNFALSDIEVGQVLKGSISKGDVVSVSETGLRDGDYDRFSIDGVPLLRKDMKVLLFLKDTDSSSYGIVDVWGGKFFYDNDGLVHASTEFIINGHHPALDAYGFPMTEAELTEKIYACK